MQLAIVALLIVLALGFVMRSSWRAWSGKKSGCSSGCGKCAATVKEEKQEGRISLPMRGK